MKLNLYLFLVFISLSFSAFSQNAKVSGKVTEDNGDGLISASVVIDASKGYGAVTDIDGNYTISLPAGSYSVTFTYLGKETQKINVTLTDGQIKSLNVVLHEKQKLMDDVVISGSKYEQKLSEQTVSMDVIKGSSLTQDNIVSLDEGMTKVPGVTIADGQINIRGGAGWSYGAGSRVQVLVDDLPILSADAADAKWSIVPMENVEQVEVIKGAASALYGSGALDGIVNVRTAYPTDQPYFKVTTYGGFDTKPTNTPDLADWWGGKQAVFGNSNWQATTTRPYSDGVSFAWRQKFGQSDITVGGAYDGGTGYVDSSASYQVRANIKYRYRFKKIPGLNMGINVSGLYDWGQTFFFWNGLDSLGYKPFPKTITVYKDYRITVDPSVDYYDKNNNQFKFIGRFLNSTNTNSTGQGSVPNKYYAEFQYHRKWDFNKFTMNLVTGVVNQYDDVNPPKGASGSLFGKNNDENFSIYAQTDFKFFKKLTISLGARWEYFNMRHYVPDTTNESISGHDTTYTIAQKLNLVQNSLKQLNYPLFRIGINYQATEATFLRASFGQGFRYPSIAERYVSTSVGALTIASNPQLQPEQGYSAEVAIKQGFKMGGSWMGFVDLSGFANFYTNMMEFSFGQFGPQEYWSGPTAYLHDYGFGFASQNIGKTRILGTELVVAGQGNAGPVALEYMLGYTFIDPRALNWNDSLALFNYQGAQLSNNSSQTQSAYNNANNLHPGSQAITYAETSTTSTNLLKYRSPHTLKIDVTASYKGFEINTNLQYSSYQKNIDYAFISPLFRALEGTAFQGLYQYRSEKEASPIGMGRGDIVWNARIGYSFKQGVKIAMLVKNLLNWEYTPRPAYFGEPRNFTFQLSYTLQPKKVKKTANN